MGPAFHVLAKEFSLLKLRVYVQFQKDTKLPSFKGSMIHGWFGHAIKAVDEHAFFILFGNHDKGQPKPYLVHPGDDLKTQYRKDELYHFDIVLFGAATNLVESVITACQYGQKLGLGPERAAFSLISICSVLPNELKVGIHKTRLSEWLQGSSYLASPHPDLTGGDPQSIAVQTELAIHCQTPIRLKTAGRIARQRVPSLEEWLNHIARRWKKLSMFWVLDNQELFNSLYQEIPRMGDYETSAHIYYEDWQRYSHKERDNLPFGGIKGQVSYFGDISLAIPWLTVGQVLHVGGKTTFGLGCYHLIH